ASVKKYARARSAAIAGIILTLRSRAGSASMAILIGVAGGTGSGKTSFAEELLGRLRPERCITVAQDSYYKDGSTLDPAARAAINYDHPDAFDTSLLIQDLRDLKAGRPVPHLTYDHATYSRRVPPAARRRVIGVNVFIGPDSDGRILRRLRRDLKERGRSFESVERQYLSSVRPMHLEFLEPSKRSADLIAPGGAGNEAALARGVARVDAMPPAAAPTATHG